MNLAFLLLCAAAPLVLTALYMVLPRAPLLKLSSARFFPVAPAGKDSSARFQWRRPPFTWPSFFQLCSLLLLLLAAVSLLARWAHRRAVKQGIEVLVALDTSASMATRQRSGTRWTAVEPALRETLELLHSSGLIGLELVTFDLSVQKRLHVPDALGNWPSIARTLAELGPTQLGTNVAALQGLATEKRTLVVITDQAAPLWAREEGGHVVWRDLALAVPNVGFTGLTATRHPLTAAVDSMTMEVTGYHWPGPTASVKIDIERPDGTHESCLVPLSASTGGPDLVVGSKTVEVAAPGLYQVHLQDIASDAYSADNDAAFVIEPRGTIELDVPAAAAWAAPLRASSGAGPQVALQVVQIGSWKALDQLRERARKAPTLAVWEETAPEPSHLTYFAHRHPIFRAINLDDLDGPAWRTLPPRPAGAAWLQPVLRSGSREIALYSSEPPLAVIPQPPAGVTRQSPPEKLDALLLLVNACQLLQESRAPAPLYTLTSPERPESSLREARLALHAEEGDTRHTAAPFEPPEEPGPAPAELRPEAVPLLPFLLVALALALAAERSLLGWKGRAWQ